MDQAEAVTSNASGDLEPPPSTRRASWRRPVALLTFFLVALWLVSPGAWEEAGDISWRRDLAAARDEATRTGRSIVVDLYATWCTPCQWMERTTFRDPRVVAALREVIPVKIDADAHPEVLTHYRARGIPTTLVLAPDLSLLDGVSGLLAPEPYLRLLERAGSSPSKPRKVQAH